MRRLHTREKGHFGHSLPSLLQRQLIKLHSRHAYLAAQGIPQVIQRAYLQRPCPSAFTPPFNMKVGAELIMYLVVGQDLCGEIFDDKMQVQCKHACPLRHSGAARTERHAAMQCSRLIGHLLSARKGTRHDLAIVAQQRYREQA